MTEEIASANRKRAAAIAAGRPEGFDEDAEYRFGKVPITDYLRGWAAVQPDRAAYIFYGREISYAELDRLSDGFANWLIANGIKMGDRVAIMLPTIPQAPIAFYGILKAGGIYVPVSPLLKKPEIAFLLSDCGARGIVIADALRDNLPDDVTLEFVLSTSVRDFIPDEPTIPILDKVFEFEGVATVGDTDFLSAIDAAGSAKITVDVDFDDIACLVYSGGTTGLPKGCIHRHRGLVYTGTTAAKYGWAADETSMMVTYTPTFWIAGQLTGIVANIVTGMGNILFTRWHAESVMKAIEVHRATHIMLLVDSVLEILDRPDFAQFDLSSLQHTLATSLLKQLTIDIRERWQREVGTTLREAGYGMTESHTADTTPYGWQEDNEDLLSEPIFCGVSMPGTCIEIRDFETGLPTPTGESGQICTRSPSIMEGYWNRPEETAETVIDGWLQTGDRGRIDASGLLHYLGRNKEMIKVRGMSVFPAEVEAALLRHPLVRMCGVTSRKDGFAGEKPVAFVILTEGMERDAAAVALNHWCVSQLASYKLPEIRFVDTLPLTPTNKVRRAELKLLVGQLAQAVS